MDYHLAKELEDAGFPQETQWVYVDVGREWPPSLILRQSTYGGGIPTAAPTLEELIEACGDKLEGITRRWKGEMLKGYGAIYIEGVKSFMSIIEGDSYTVAVARLWLALNKKV